MRPIESHQEKRIASLLSGPAIARTLASKAGPIRIEPIETGWSCALPDTHGRFEVVECPNMRSAIALAVEEGAVLPPPVPEHRFTVRGGTFVVNDSALAVRRWDHRRHGWLNAGWVVEAISLKDGAIDALAAARNEREAEERLRQIVEGDFPIEVMQRLRIGRRYGLVVYGYDPGVMYGPRRVIDARPFAERELSGFAAAHGFTIRISGLWGWEATRPTADHVEALVALERGE